jgi:hypothetical protein
MEQPGLMERPERTAQMAQKAQPRMTQFLRLWIDPPCLL